MFNTQGDQARGDGVSIVEACLATTAASIFLPNHRVRGINYVDGGLGYANPSDLAMQALGRESSPLPMMARPYEGMTCFVSIGTGLPTFDLEKSSRLTPTAVTVNNKTMKKITEIALECERTPSAFCSSQSVPEREECHLF